MPEIGCYQDSRTCTSFESPATAPEIALMIREFTSRPSLVTQSGMLRCSVAAISFSEDAKVEIEPVGLKSGYTRWQSEQWRRSQPRLLTSPGPAHNK